MRQEIIDYIENRILRNYSDYFQSKDYYLNALEKREVFYTIEKYISLFLNKEPSPRWVCIPGLRGVGKSTLLKQLYFSIFDQQMDNSDGSQLEGERILRSTLIFSVDEITENFNSNIFEIISTLEKLHNESLEQKKPCFLFLDEVHYDPKWAATLKTFYDRSPNVFIICTGSSAIDLETNTDEIRRITFEKLYPVSFTQYLSMTNSLPQSIKLNDLKKVQSEIKNSMWQSANAEEVYLSLRQQSQSLDLYWQSIIANNDCQTSKKEIIHDYLFFASLPFTYEFINISKLKAYEAIENSIEKIINIDLEQYENFRILKSTIKQFLYLLASSGDTISLETFSSSLSINKATAAELLEALLNSGLLVRLYPRAKPQAQLRKSSKYLFISPAIRAAILHSFGGEKLILDQQGHLLEDAAILYLQKEFSSQTNLNIYYMYQKNTVDFSLDFTHKEILMEVSFGFKDASQIKNSLKYTGEKKIAYSLVFCKRELSIEENIVFIPWQWLFLL